MKSYKAGIKVRVNGKIYQCKEGSVAGWCTLRPYKPG